MVVESQSFSPAQLQLQTGKIAACLQLLDPLQTLRFTAGRPNFHGLLIGNQQPTETGAVGLIGRHLAAQGGEASRTFIRRAGEFNHKVGTKGREATLLLRRQRLPALKAHQGRIGTQDRAVRQTESARTLKHLPTALLIRPEQQPHHQPTVASTGFAACGCHGDHMSIGSKLEHGLAILCTHQFKLLWGQPQICRQAQGCQGVP